MSYPRKNSWGWRALVVNELPCAERPGVVGKFLSGFGSHAGGFVTHP